MKFKLILILATLVPFLAFGQEGTVCYKADTELSLEVPKVLCLEGMHLSDEADMADYMAVESKDHSFPTLIKLSQFSRYSAEKFSFVVETTLINITGGGCEAGLFTALKISGGSYMNQVRYENLIISVKVISTNDTCHSTPTEQIVQYKRI